MDRDKKYSNNQLENCPCYPNCDEMMNQPWTERQETRSYWPPRPSMPVPSYDPPENPMRMNYYSGYPDRRNNIGMETMPDNIMYGTNGNSQRMEYMKPDGYWNQRTNMEMDRTIRFPENREMESPDQLYRNEFRQPGQVTQDELKEEQENDKDMGRMKNMCPDLAKKIQQYVEETCDDMDYEGSPMYDEQPDKVRFRNMVQKIFERVSEDYPVEETDDKDDLFAMNKEGRRRYPPGKNWLSDFAETLLYHEMFRRRCRHRHCRRWY